jgi:hypothetical protein
MRTRTVYSFSPRLWASSARLNDKVHTSSLCFNPASTLTISLFELGEIECVAAELNPHFLVAWRAMKGELLLEPVVHADPNIGRFHQRLGAGVFAAMRRSP